MTVKLEVGKVYRRRDGELVRIVAIKSDEDFPYIAELINKDDYTPEGKYLDDGRKSVLDLVEEVK